MKKKSIILTVILFLALLLAQPVMAEGVRISGANRYDTAVQVSKAVFDKSYYAILASGENFLDALPASTLANAFGAPILLVQKSSVPKETYAELDRLKVENVYILGGKATVNESVEKALKAKGYEVQRIGGKNRYETSELIFKELLEFTTIDEIAVASNEADAVSSSGLRGDKIALILINDKAPSDFVKSLEVKKTCLGGTNSISESTYKAIGSSKRIAGSNRFATALKIAEASNKPNVIVVNGYNFVDAFTGSVYAYKKEADILLTQDKALNQETGDYIQKLNPKEITIIGGKNSVSEDVYKKLITMVKDEDVISDPEPWKKAYNDVIQNESYLKTLPVEVFCGDSGRKGQVIKKSYALFDIDKDGVPELVLEVKYDSQEDVRFSEILFFRWDGKESVVKYVYGSTIQDQLIQHRGFNKKSNILLIGDILHQMGSYAFMEYRDGSMYKLEEYVRNKFEFSVVKYKSGKEIASTPISEDEYEKVFDEAYKELIYFTDILIPYKGSF